MGHRYRPSLVSRDDRMAQPIPPPGRLSSVITQPTRGPRPDLVLEVLRLVLSLAVAVLLILGLLPLLVHVAG
jgi:hypothetical protein